MLTCLFFYSEEGGSDFEVKKKAASIIAMKSLGMEDSKALFALALFIDPSARANSCRAKHMSFQLTNVFSSQASERYTYGPIQSANIMNQNTITLLSLSTCLVAPISLP